MYNECFGLHFQLRLSWHRSSRSVPCVQDLRRCMDKIAEDLGADDLVEVRWDDGHVGREAQLQLIRFTLW